MFTGDGDFRYLIEKLIEKGARVRLFSTYKRDQFGEYRISTRLKELLSEYEASEPEKRGSFIFTELDNIRNRIAKSEDDNK